MKRRDFWIGYVMRIIIGGLVVAPFWAELNR